MKLLNWLIENFFEDRFVPREDFDHVQAREFPAIQRDMDMLRRQRDVLLQENHRLICDGLHNHAFLPKFADNRGTIDVEVVAMPVRERFETRVFLTISDSCHRAVQGRLRPQVFGHLARMLAEHVKRNLLRQFEPPYPGRPA